MDGALQQKVKAFVEQEKQLLGLQLLAKDVQLRELQDRLLTTERLSETRKLRNAPIALFLHQDAAAVTNDDTRTLRLHTLGLVPAELAQVLRALPSAEFQAVAAVGVVFSESHVEMLCTATAAGKLKHIFLTDAVMLHGVRSSSLLSAAVKSSPLLSLDVAGVLWPDAACRGRLLHALSQSKTLQHLGITLLDDLSVEPAAAATGCAAPPAPRGAASRGRRTRTTRGGSTAAQTEPTKDEGSLPGSVAHLCDLLSAGGMQGVRSLCLRGSRIAHAPCKRLLGLTAEAPITRFLSQLLVLDVSNSVFPAEGTEWLRQALRWPAPQVTAPPPAASAGISAPQQTDRISMAAFNGHFSPFQIKAASSSADSGADSGVELTALPLLTSLEVLDMHSCCLSGQFDSLTLLTEQFGSHARLRVLRMDGNDLTQEVSATLGQAAVAAFHTANASPTAQDTSSADTSYCHSEGNRVLFLGSAADLLHGNVASDSISIQSAPVNGHMIHGIVSSWKPAMGATTSPPAAAAAKSRSKSGARPKPASVVGRQRRRQQPLTAAPTEASQPVYWSITRDTSLQDLPLGASTPAPTAGLAEFAATGAASSGPIATSGAHDEEQGYFDAIWSACCADAASLVQLVESPIDWVVHATWTSLGGTAHRQEVGRSAANRAAVSRESLLQEDFLPAGCAAALLPRHAPRLWFSARVSLPPQLALHPQVHISVGKGGNRSEAWPEQELSVSVPEFAGRPSGAASSAVLL